jgi:hypothetical protein
MKVSASIFLCTGKLSCSARFSVCQAIAKCGPGKGRSTAVFHNTWGVPLYGLSKTPPPPVEFDKEEDS